MIDLLVNRLEELADDLRRGASTLGLDMGIAVISAWEELLGKSDRAALADVRDGLGTLREALEADEPNPITIGQQMVGLGDAVEYVAGLARAPFVLSEVAQLLQNQGSALAQGTVTPGLVEANPADAEEDEAEAQVDAEVTTSDDSSRDFGGIRPKGDSGDLPVDADGRKGQLGANKPGISDSMPFDEGTRIEDTGEGEWRGTAYANPEEHK